MGAGSTHTSAHDPPIAAGLFGQWAPHAFELWKLYNELWPDVFNRVLISAVQGIKRLLTDQTDLLSGLRIGVCHRRIWV